MEKTQINHGEKILWLMGPTSSGKTTITKALCKRLRESGIPTVYYDGDETRNLMGHGHGFEPEERLRVVKAIVYMANKAAEAGLFVIVAALTAHDDARRYVQKNVKQLLIGYVNCDIKICASRDPKGLYRQAKDGKIDTLIGINSIYQSPEYYDIELRTDKYSLADSVQQVMTFLKANDFVKFDKSAANNP